MLILDAVHKTDRLSNTAVGVTWKKRTTVLFHLVFFSSFLPQRLFAAEIFLGPGGEHIPPLTVVQSLTIADPPSPLRLPRFSERSERQAVQTVWTMFCGESAALPEQFINSTLKSLDSAQKNNVTHTHQ